MATNKHAQIRCHVLDKCFSNVSRRYYIEDLIAACNAALYDFLSSDTYGKPFNPGISCRQLLVDITFIENETGWGALIERFKDGRRVYYR